MALFLAFAVGGQAPTALAQTPAVVFSSASGVSSIDSAAGAGDYGGTAAHLAANSRGDVFINVQTGSNTYVLDRPANNGTPVALITGIGQNGSGHSVYVDSKNNIWVADTGDAQILYIPYGNGSYPTNVAHSTLANCSAFPVPATQTTACVVPLNYPSTLGYYIQVSDLGFDAAGNLYLLDKFTGGNPSAYPNNDVLIKVSPSTGNFTILNSSLGNDGNSQIAVDPAGDVLVVNYGSVTLYTAAGNYTSSSAQSVFSMNNPTGVSIDNGGNFYISNTGNSDIVEIPSSSLTGSTISVNTDYILSNQLSTGYTSSAGQGVGVDGFGNVYYAGGGYPNSLSLLTVGRLAFGAVTVGTTSGSQTLNVVFNASVTFGKFSIASPGGAFAATSTTCSGAYTAGGNCSVTLTYSAGAAGLQAGTIEAFDSNKNLLGNATLSGVGTAAQIDADPGTLAVDGAGYKAPSAVATDRAGNIYVADSTTGVIYKTQSGSATTTTVASGFSSPSAIAVDGGGDLFIGDAGNKQIVEVPYNSSSSTYAAHQVVLTGLSGASGLAVDGRGGLYVADSGNARVLYLQSSGGQTLGTLVSTFGTGFSKPVAVAVDRTNNFVYVSDAGAKQITQINLYTSQQGSALTGMTTPAGVAVDAAGTVYAVDSGKKTVTRLPYLSGALSSNAAQTLPTIVASPVAVAIDSSGNLYVADTVDAAVSTAQRTVGLLNFGNVNVNSNSTTVSAQISNSGVLAFKFASPFYSGSGSTGSFAVQGSSTCVNAGTVSQGASCTVASVFSPTAKGSVIDTLSFSGSGTTLALTGTGTQLATSTLAVSVTSPVPPAQPAYGQTITVQANLSPAAGSTGTPGGTVTFYVDNVVQVPAASINNDIATYTLTGLVGGMHTLSASYSGDSNFAYSASPAITITVNKAASTTSLAIFAPYTAPSSAKPGDNVTLTATVTPATAGAPSGTVTFYNGSTALGTGTVVPVTVASVTTYQATLNISTLALGTYSITASYGGDVNYNGSATLPGLALIITNPTILMTASAATITGGGPAVNLTITSVAGFSNSADLACSGLPQYATCSFSPPVASPVPGSPAVVALSVLINQPPVVKPSGAGWTGTGCWSLACTAALLAWLGLFGLRRRTVMRRLQMGLALLVLFGAGLGIGGCSGNSSSSYATPKGTTTLTVNATITTGAVSPSPTQSLTLQLIVN